MEDAPAWIDEEGRHSTAGLLADAPPLPDVLPGDVVAIHRLVPRDQWSAMLAIWARDAVVFPIGAREPAATRQALVREAGASFLVDDQGAHPTDVPVRARAPGAVTVLATSGTMGMRTLVVHDADAHAAATDAQSQALRLTSEHTWLLSLSLHHVGGFGIARRMQAVGGTVVQPRSLQHLGTALAQFQPTHVSLVPAQLRRLLADDGARKALALCQAVVLGGGPAPAALRQAALDAGIQLVITYGMTESLAFLAMSDDPVVVAQGDTAGHVLPGRRVTQEADGTLSINAPSLHRGTIHGGVVHPRPDGPYASNDMGALDDKGLLRVFGRKDRCFVSGGENVHPEEIERALCAVPGVDDAVVVGIADRTFGTRPVAFVAGSRAPLDLSEALRTTLAGYKVPVAWYRLPAGATPATLKAGLEGAQTFESL